MNPKLILGLVLIVVGAVLFLNSAWIGIGLIIVGVLFVIFRKGESIIEERQDLNKSNH